jgi:hypothetical protein
MSESSQLVADIQLKLGRGDVRLLRINSGSGWSGKIVEKTPQRIVLASYHHVQFAPAGTADLLGCVSHRITSDMVGQLVAIAVGIEAKTGTGRPTKEQRSFIEQLIRIGGRAGIARSVDDAQMILSGEVRK